MSRRVLLVPLVSLLFASLVAVGQQRNPQGRPPAGPAEASAKPTGSPTPDAKKEAPEQPPVVTHHEIHVGGRSLRYTATAGMMPLKNTDTGEVEAHIFYIAYTLEAQAAERRPLTFSFNGGPGSASVWLHLGAIGPKRVRMQPDGMLPAPPYQLVDNEYTWLDQTDLVFIDPVGTGYSRAVKRDQTAWPEPAGVDRSPSPVRPSCAPTPLPCSHAPDRRAPATKSPPATELETPAPRSQAACRPWGGRGGIGFTTSVAAAVGGANGSSGGATGGRSNAG